MSNRLTRWISFLFSIFTKKKKTSTKKKKKKNHVYYKYMLFEEKKSSENECPCHVRARNNSLRPHMFESSNLKYLTILFREYCLCLRVIINCIARSTVGVPWYATTKYKTHATPSPPSLHTRNPVALFHPISDGCRGVPRGLEADIFCLCLAHTKHSKNRRFVFQRTDRSSSATRNLKTDLNSS